MLTDTRPAWQEAISAWDAQRIRKVVRRARGAEWQRAVALDGLTVAQGSAEVRVFPPIPIDEWPRDLARLQVGGTDQWGNITLGIDLIRRVTGDEAYGLAWPLLTRADGSKFGKSEGGSVWLSPEKTSPYDFFQYWVNASDDDVRTYLRLFTDLADEEVAELLAAPPEQRAAQRRLAHEVTSTVHGPEGVAAAERASTALFGGDPATLSEQEILSVFADAPSSEGRLDGTTLLDLFAEALEGGSKSAARRTAAQGGAYVNNRQETELERPVREEDLVAGRYLLLRKGRKRYHLVRFG